MIHIKNNLIIKNIDKYNNKYLNNKNIIKQIFYKK